MKYDLYMPTIAQVQEFRNAIEPEPNESTAGLPQHAEHYKTEFDFEVRTNLMKISSYI